MRGRMPMKLVLILIIAVAVNTLIIESFFLMLKFEDADTLDAEYLSILDSPYGDCTLVDTFVDLDEYSIPWDNHFTFHLLENDAGRRMLVVVENHFLLPRIRYREDLSMAVPSFGSNEVPVFGTDSGQLGYICTLARDGTIEEAHAHGQTGPHHMLFLIPLLIVEYIAFIFLFRREEIR